MELYAVVEMSYICALEYGSHKWFLNTRNVAGESMELMFFLMTEFLFAK